MSDFWLLAGVVLLVLELRSAHKPELRPFDRRKAVGISSAATG